MTSSIKLQPGEQVEHPNAPGVMLKNPSDQTLILSDFSENGFSAEIETASPPPVQFSKKLTSSPFAQLPPGTSYKRLLRDSQNQIVGMVNAVTPVLMRPKRKASQRDDRSRLGRRLR